MKKIFKITTLLIVAALFTTGCATKAEYGFKITKDKKVSLEVISALDNEYIDGLMSMGEDESKEYTDADRWAFLEKDDYDDNAGDFEGYKKEKYDKDGFKGYVYTADLGNIDDLIADNNEATDIEKIGETKKLFTKKGNSYALNLKLSDDQQNSMSQYAEMIVFNAQVKVTLPNKAKSNNATSVEGNTYIWDLTKAKTVEIEFDLNKSNLPMILGVCGGVVVLGAIVCAVVVSKRKKSA